jgi:hypothetical protein
MYISHLFLFSSTATFLKKFVANFFLPSVVLFFLGFFLSQGFMSAKDYFPSSSVSSSCSVSLSHLFFCFILRNDVCI